MDMGNAEKNPRIQAIDAARGLAIVLMVCHHALYDLVYFFDAPWWFYSNPVFDVLHYFFVGVFIIVSGISSRFSRGNVERGAIVIVFAIIITYVTVRIIDEPIYFGILHLLGTFMIFYGISRRFLDKIPIKVAVSLYLALTVASLLALAFLSPTSNIPAIRDILSVLGWWQKGFQNSDYQTVLPWIFIFLLGTRMGEQIKEGKFPKWFYEARFPFFPLVGRNALVIYVCHQPIFYGIAQMVLYIGYL